MGSRNDWKQWDKGKKKRSVIKYSSDKTPVKCLSSNEVKSYYKKNKKSKECYKNRIKHKKIEVDFELYDWKPTDELDIYLWKNT